MDDITRDTARSYFWNQVAVVLDGATVTLAYFAVGRLSGAERLGEFGWMFSAGGLVVLAAGLGLRESSAILVQRAAGDDALLAGLLRKCLLVRGAAAVCAGSAMAALVLFNGASRALAAAACAWVAAIMLANFIATFDLALFRARPVAAGKSASSIVALSLVVTGAVLGSTAFIFAGLALGAAAGTFFYAIPLRFLRGVRPAAYPFRRLVGLSWTLWVVGFLNYVVNLQGVPAVMKAARVEAETIGFFAAGLAIAVAANRLLIGGFANVILAAFSRADLNGEVELARLHSLYVRASAVLTLPVLLGVAVFADDLARIPLARDSHRAAEVIRILSAAFIGVRLLGGGAHSSGLFATGRHKAALSIRVVFAVVMLSATGLAASTGDIAKVAAAAGAVAVAVVLAEWVYLLAVRGIGLPAAALARLGAACLLAAAPAAVLAAHGGLYWTLAAGFLFAACQFAALWLAAPLAPGEVDLIGGGGLVARFLRLFEAAPRGD